MATVVSFTQPLLTSLSTALTLCAEIKRNRHCGSIHTQLDLLEASLLDGLSFITSQCAGLESIPILPTSQQALADYTTQLALICGRLESIAHPSRSSHSHTESESKHHSHSHHKHEHRSHLHSGSSSDEWEKEKEHHHHKHYSNTKPLIFSAFEPIHHHRHGKEIEDPHFHEIKEEWEGVRQEIGATLAGLRINGKGREEVIVEKTEKVEIKEETGAIEEVVEKVEKVEIKEEEVVAEVKEEVKHTEVHETEIIVVEVEVEESHHESHDDTISPLDSGSESEEDKKDEDIGA